MLSDKKEIQNSRAFYERFRNVEDDELYNDDVDEDYDELSVAPLEVASEGYVNLVMISASRWCRYEKS